MKGFSERNLKRMVQFAAEYPELRPIGPQLVAQLLAGEFSPTALAAVNDPSKVQQLVAQLPWGQNVILMEKFKDLHARLWYVQSSRPRQMEVAALN